MAGLGPDEVRVVIRGAGKGGRSLRYVRPFAGLIVADAIRRLDSDDKERGGLPGVLVTVGPYYLNGEKVYWDSGVVLKRGDVLSADCP